MEIFPIQFSIINSAVFNERPPVFNKSSDSEGLYFES